MSKRLLVIAYHYPPIHSSSGVHRTVNFVRYLPEHGWEPCVLTIHPRAYEVKSEAGKSAWPDVPTHRAFALDTQRHLSIMGRYPKLLAMPDRWISWWLGAIPAGLAMIRRYRPDAIFSTYPIATAHLIGLTLHKLTGLPWVADFRDPMTEPNYPKDPAIKACHRWIENKAIGNCSHAVFTTPDSMQMCMSRYPDASRPTYSVITNGFDEDVFLRAEQDGNPPSPREEWRTGKQLVLIHSGTFYRTARDPLPFLSAVKELAGAGLVSSGSLRIILRACGDENFYGETVRQLGIDDIVRLEPSVTYNAAIAEMLDADGLLLFQGPSCNHQIPAKAYEYIRSGRPVLTLADPSGNTALLMREAGLDCIADISSTDEIKKVLADFIEKVQTGTCVLPDMDTVMKYSRRHKTSELATILDDATRCGQPIPDTD